MAKNIFVEEADRLLNARTSWTEDDPFNHPSNLLSIWYDLLVPYNDFVDRCRWDEKDMTGEPEGRKYLMAEIEANLPEEAKKRRAANDPYFNLGNYYIPKRRRLVD